MKLDRNIKLHTIGLTCILSIIGLWTAVYYPSFPNSILYSTYVIVLCFFSTCWLSPQPRARILIEQRYQILPIVFSSYCVALVTIAMLRVDYSRTALTLGLILSSIWFSAYYFWSCQRMKAKLLYLSNVNTKRFEQFKNLELKPMSNNTQIKEVDHGVLVNLHKPLSRNEEGFLADCSLSNIPIYHSHLLKERLDKQISTAHLTQNTIEALSPNINYLKFRSIIEKVLIISLTPLILPLLLVTAVLVKINLPSEPVLFRQERVGRNATQFSIYKFRTMKSKEDNEASFATSEHQRISRLGRWLRQLRFDELPQLLNVLKDEMSIIGPRPEQLFFVEQYQQEIPFYNYRHIVKPGITGWAQIEQGYTDSLQSTKHKLSYDLYYIKHLSLELDLYIAIKTLKIIFQRKGA